jgi:hypothetical protein
MRTRSRQRSPRWWRGHVDGWQKSGISQRDYCEAHGLALSTFQLWRRRLMADRPTVVPVEIVPVAHAASSPYLVLSRSEQAAPPPIVLVVGRGRYRLELSDGLSGATLRTVLNVLEAVS